MYSRFFSPQAALLAVIFCLPLRAQAPAPITPPNSIEVRSQALRALERDVAHNAVRKGAAVDESRQRELLKRLTDFAESWNKLMTNAGKGVWNAKEARKTREAFERLIRSGAWVEDGKPEPVVVSAAPAGQ